MQKRNNLFTTALRIHLTIDSKILNVDQLGDLIYFDTTFRESYLYDLNSKMPNTL